MTSTPTLPRPLRWTPESTQWWPAAAVGAACYVSLFPPELFDYSLLPSFALSVVLGMLSATLFSLTFVRWSSVWRQATLPGHPLLWLLLTPLLLFWSLFSWFLGMTVVLAVTSGSLPSPTAVLDWLPPALSGLDALMTGVVGWLAFGLMWRLSPQLGASNPDPVFPGWKGWDTALGCVITCSCLYLGWLCQAGRQFDPELIKLREEPSLSDTLHGHTASQRRVLPEAFRNDPDVARMLQTLPRAKSYEEIPVPLVFSAWLAYVRPQLIREDFWRDPEIFQMGRFGWYFVGVGRSAKLREKGRFEDQPRVAEEVEIGWISALLTLDQPYWDGELVSSVEKVELPGPTWARLVEIGLRRTDLVDGTPLSPETAKHTFRSEMYLIDPDREPRNPSYTALRSRIRVNRAWRSLKAAGPSPNPPAPDVATYEKLRAQSPFEPDADPYALVGELNGNRQDAVAALVIMELKRLRAEGQPMPDRPSLLRPEIERLVNAYATWVTLEGDDAEVRVTQASRTFHIQRVIGAEE